MDENNTNINEIIETAAEVLPETFKRKPGFWSWFLVFWATVGVGATVYFMYKGIRYAITKCKDGSIKISKQNASKPEKAPEKTKAEEETEE